LAEKKRYRRAAMNREPRAYYLISSKESRRAEKTSFKAGKKKKRKEK